MERSEKSVKDAKYYKEKANLWADRFDNDLDKYLGEDNVTIDGLAELIWNQGILGHIAPEDKDEFEARKFLDKDVFERSDPDLYWRVIYAAGNTKGSIEGGMTLVGGYTTAVILKALGRFSVKNNKKYQELFGEDNAVFTIVDRIIKRGEEELSERGIRPHDKFIPIGSVGNFKGIKIKIVRYTPDGLIAFETFNRDDYNKIGELNEYKNTISPGEIKLENFSIPDSAVKESTIIK